MMINDIDKTPERGLQIDMKIMINKNKNTGTDN